MLSLFVSELSRTQNWRWCRKQNTSVKLSFKWAWLSNPSHTMLFAVAWLGHITAWRRSTSVLLAVSLGGLLPGVCMPPLSLLSWVHLSRKWFYGWVAGCSYSSLSFSLWQIRSIYRMIEVFTPKGTGVHVNEGMLPLRHNQITYWLTHSSSLCQTYRLSLRLRRCSIDTMHHSLPLALAC